MAKPKPGLGRGLSELMGNNTEGVPTRRGYDEASESSSSQKKSHQESHQEGADIFFSGNSDVSRETSHRQRSVMPSLAEILGQRHDGKVAGKLQEIPLDKIKPNAQQPRTVFDEDELAELADSIKSMGVLQPIVVRPRDDHFEIIMGERRWRASTMAGKETIPAIIRQVDDNNLLRDALVENIHRTQLNPLEEAAAYEQLLKNFKLTQSELADMVSKSRSQITNTIRLLRLPASVQRRVAAGVISSGHARALLGLPNAAAMELICDRIIKEGLSVRATEEIVAMTDTVKPQRKKKSTPTPVPQEIRVRENQLMDMLETNVSVKPGKSKGRIVIDYADEADLDRIINVIKK